MAAHTSLLEQLLASGDAGELDRFRVLLDENVVVHAPFGLSTQGIEAEIASWRQAKAAIPDLRHEVQTIVCEGSYESARCVVAGTLRGEYGGFHAEATPFRVDQAVFARIQDGKIVELWEIVDTKSLLDQLRASED